MFKLKNILSQKQLATVYRALIESHLRYCSVIWGCLSNTKLESLQRLQNRARRLIECARHKDGWVCDWLDVRNLVRYDRLITTYKINNGRCPENLKINSLLGRIFRDITQEKLMISKFLAFVLSTAKSLLDTREQVPGTRSQSKYETPPH